MRFARDISISRFCTHHPSVFVLSLSLCVASHYGCGNEEVPAAGGEPSAIESAENEEENATLTPEQRAKGCALDTAELAAPLPVELAIELVSAFSGNPYDGVAVRVCEASDIDCESPLSEPGNTDDNGMLTLSIDASKDLYLEFTRERLLPTLALLPTGTFVEDQEEPFTLPLVNASATVLLRDPDGKPVDMSQAIVSGEIALCDAKAAEGLTASLEDDNGDTYEPVYVHGNFPDPEETATDEDGRFMFINTEPGPGVVSVSLGDETAIEAHSVSRPGTLTILRPDARLGYMPSDDGS